LLLSICSVLYVYGSLTAPDILSHSEERHLINMTLTKATFIIDIRVFHLLRAHRFLFFTASLTPMFQSDSFSLPLEVTAKAMRSKSGIRISPHNRSTLKPFPTATYTTGDLTTSSFTVIEVDVIDCETVNIHGVRPKPGTPAVRQPRGRRSSVGVHAAVHRRPVRVPAHALSAPHDNRLYRSGFFNGISNDRSYRFLR
jgi:hypothetical protein